MRFGTDGVRGEAGTELTPEFALMLGRAAARVLNEGSEARGAFLVGRDTRISGPMLQAALASGIAAEGVDVVDLGVAPTPAIAALSARWGVPGAVVSASHNAFGDNGVKLFASGGRKLDDGQEQEIEARLYPGGTTTGLTGRQIGRVSSEPGALDWYCESLVEALEGRRLGGLRVVVDCANGAASVTAPRILRSAGADLVETIGISPDGVNINAGCGSTDPLRLVAAVRHHRADAGLALDGDGDRVIAVAGTGDVVDGDRLLALFARDLKARGRLAGNTLVVTVMSNLGLLRQMEAADIDVHQTAVGDRHVLEALDANGWVLGGEQSGHIVFRDRATTGDGVMSGLLLLDLVARSGRPLAELAADAMERLPQVLQNVPVQASPAEVATSGVVLDELKAVEERLGHDGRVVLRPSGTEPLVRVMVEALTAAQAHESVERLVAAVRAASEAVAKPA